MAAESCPFVMMVGAVVLVVVLSMTAVSANTYTIHFKGPQPSVGPLKHRMTRGDIEVEVQAGDKLVFDFNNAITFVAEVTESNFKGCMHHFPLREHHSGHSLLSFDIPGTRYFTSNHYHLCVQGWKLIVKTADNNGSAMAPTMLSSETTAVEHPHVDNHETMAPVAAAASRSTSSVIVTTTTAATLSTLAFPKLWQLLVSAA
ncbi:unnamed protein product [Calypogeia fissa]